MSNTLNVSEASPVEAVLPMKAGFYFSMSRELVLKRVVGAVGKIVLPERGHKSISMRTPNLKELCGNSLRKYTLIFSEISTTSPVDKICLAQPVVLLIARRLIKTHQAR
jgi:hypothetical protein